ncbi:SDR family oxidoreductase [Pseudooceanicola sp. CBS1P-1]|uniref:NAD-dependent epimerase/dehydratase family protein n=1 Tax=Pseudooceanicola albus TaxID=2692189 RepID=A0A6L7G711_9RHOB|nr:MULTISPECIES: SDR family oxidoreductase [Pseudooceanicola]MBT9384401.1 SDR family oxidoreductase [Pseudooceanicola endophyticus]MXN19861.1 NAD-dependent epimerase/dehydratase family protein [Pseudooceanicola albus]
MARTNKVALVIGANGVIGGNLIRHLQTLEDWEVIGVSRRGGVPGARLRYIRADLLDAEDTRRKLSGLHGVTHVFYAAYQDRPGWADLVPPNLAMLTHVIDAIEPVAPALEHVSLMQGYKVYGAHLGPFKTPARESDAHHMPPEFNIDQQQFLERRQQGKRWSWSALRPSVVVGFGLGNPMNLTMAIAVYATMSKALGLPLRFPGRPGAYHSLLEMTDADLLARATVWAATEPACANQAFNITNGDLFRWSEMWPKIARAFDLEVAPPLPMTLATIMADKAPLWADLVARHGLAEPDYARVSSWGFADAVFGWDYDFFADGSKARRLGFHDFIDTEAMFLGAFDELRARRIIPPAA